MIRRNNQHPNGEGVKQYQYSSKNDAITRIIFNLLVGGKIDLANLPSVEKVFASTSTLSCANLLNHAKQVLIYNQDEKEILCLADEKHTTAAVTTKATPAPTTATVTTKATLAVSTKTTEPTTSDPDSDITIGTYVTAIVKFTSPSLTTTSNPPNSDYTISSYIKNNVTIVVNFTSFKSKM